MLAYNIFTKYVIPGISVFITAQTPQHAELYRNNESFNVSEEENAKLLGTTVASLYYHMPTKDSYFSTSED